MINFVKESAPHLRRKSSVSRMMIDVIIALLPTLVFATVVYTFQLVWPLLISIVTMVGAEFVWFGLTHMIKFDGKKHTLVERFKYAYKDYTVNNLIVPLVSAIIYTLILAPTMPLYGFFVGALVGIVIGKLVFGGTGSNIFNPAGVGMVFAKLCFGSKITYTDNWFFTIPDVSAGGTALGSAVNGIENIYQFNLLDMFIGKMPGTLGEAFSVTLLIGGIYLLVRRAADWRIMLTYFGTFSIMMLFAGLCIHSLYNDIGVWYYLAFQILSGGLLFGGIFMLTDPVTSPTNRPGRVIYAMIAAVCTVFIRIFGSLPEGVGFSILIANIMPWHSSKAKKNSKGSYFITRRL